MAWKIFKHHGVDVPKGHRDDAPDAATLHGMLNATSLLFSDKVPTGNIPFSEELVSLLQCLKTQVCAAGVADWCGGRQKAAPRQGM